MKTHLLKCLLALIAMLATNCTMSRTAETDKLGWTNPDPPLPSIRDHSPTPGMRAYNRGVAPVSQPDGYAMRGSYEGSRSALNDPLQY